MYLINIPLGVTLSYFSTLSAKLDIKYLYSGVVLISYIQATKTPSSDLLYYYNQFNLAGNVSYLSFLNLPTSHAAGIVFSTLIYFSKYLFLGSFKLWIFSLSSWVTIQYMRFTQFIMNRGAFRLVFLLALLLSPYFFIANAHLCRQMMSASLALMAFRKTGLKKLVWFSLSISIHGSALFLLVLYGLFKVVKPTRYLLIYWIGAVVAGLNLVLGLELLPFLQSIQDNAVEQESILLLVMISYFILFFVRRSLFEHPLLGLWLIASLIISLLGMLNSLIYYRLYYFVIPFLFVIPVFVWRKYSLLWIEMSYILFCVVLFFYTIRNGAFEYSYGKSVIDSITFISILKTILS